MGFVTHVFLLGWATQAAALEYSSVGASSASTLAARFRNRMELEKLERSAERAPPQLRRALKDAFEAKEEPGFAGSKVLWSRERVAPSHIIAS